MAEGSIIQTGVDKLVELVKSSKRISVADAAKSLNVSKVVVEEWADFLEEEGIISIEYKFTTPYLVDRVLSKKEVEEKVKDFQGKREGFVRKAEVALNLLDKKGGPFTKIKDEFKKLKQDLSHDLDTVQEELRLLEKYNDEKRNIDNQIQEQEKTFKQKIMSMESQIVKEKQRYQDILRDLKKEQVVLNKERVRAMSIKQMVKTLESSTARFENTLTNIKGRLVAQEHSIENTNSHIVRLKEMADSAKQEMQQKRAQMEELLKKSYAHERKISELQDSILKKTATKKKILMKSVQEGKSSAERFSRFFAHNSQIEAYLNKITQDKHHLEQELDGMIHKAKAFNLVSKSQDVRTYISDLQKKFKQIEKGKADFERDVTKLRKFM